MFQESADNIDELTDVVCSYISFCKDSVILTRDVTFFPNNKPWVSKVLKGLTCKRKIDFNEGDVNAEREARKDSIKKGKAKV